MVIKFGKRRWALPSPPIFINLFVTGIVLLPIYIKLMGVLGQILSVPTTVTTYLYYGVLWLLLLIGIWEIKNHIIYAVIMAILLAVALLMELFLFPENSAYILDGDAFSYAIFQPTALLQSTLFVFVGLAVTNFEHLGRLLHRAARIGVLAATLTYLLMLLFGVGIHYDDMSTAYGVSLIMCILVAFKENGDWKYIVMGSVCLILGGTRGPIICLLVAAIFRFIIFEDNIYTKARGIFLCIIGGLVVISGVGLKLLELLNDFFAMFGQTNLRILDYINEGVILNGSGRDDFAYVLLEAIKKHPFVGYGVGADRLILGGYYAHNLVLEVLVSFGVIVGGIFLVWIICLSLRMFTSQKLTARKLAIGLFCGIVVKLCLSSTFIESREFFLFLGLCIAAKGSCGLIEQTEKR